MFSKCFLKNPAFYEKMWKNMVQPDTPQMTNIINHMHFACWITKGTDNMQNIITAFPLKQRLQEHASMLCYTYIAWCFVSTMLAPHCLVYENFLLTVCHTKILCFIPKILSTSHCKLPYWNLPHLPSCVVSGCCSTLNFNNHPRFLESTVNVTTSPYLQSDFKWTVGTSVINLQV
jgi:hypothetical protein